MRQKRAENMKKLRSTVSHQIKYCKNDKTNYIFPSFTHWIRIWIRIRTWILRIKADADPELHDKHCVSTKLEVF